MCHESDQLVRDLLESASELEARGYLGSGLLRRAARAIAEHVRDEGATSVCPRCGDPVTQPRTGRRRTWCSSRCRKAAAKRGRKSTMHA
jgi:hypothetical protein